MATQDETGRCRSCKAKTRLVGGLERSAGRPAQEFRRAHPALSFELNFRQRQSAIRGRHHKFPVLAQNFARLSAKIDNRCRKNVQITTVEFSERSRPGIVTANFSLD